MYPKHQHVPKITRSTQAPLQISYFNEIRVTMTIQPHSSSIRGLTVRPSINNNTDSGMAPDLDLGGRGNNDRSFLLIVTLTWCVWKFAFSYRFEYCCYFSQTIAAFQSHPFFYCGAAEVRSNGFFVVFLKLEYQGYPSSHKLIILLLFQSH
jgi:hypothetical protein